MAAVTTTTVREYIGSPAPTDTALTDFIDRATGLVSRWVGYTISSAACTSDEALAIELITASIAVRSQIPLTNDERARAEDFWQRAQDVIRRIPAKPGYTIWGVTT